MKPSLVLLCLICHDALALSSSGYFVAGVGSRNGKGASQAALGGEFVIRKVIGVGAEIGAIAGHHSFAAFSVNGSYHLPVSSLDKVDPFVIGGYTRAAELLGSEGNAVNFGGGLLYWFYRRLGLRLEFRGFIQPGTNGSAQIDNGLGRIYSFRAGIAFR